MATDPSKRLKEEKTTLELAAEKEMWALFLDLHSGNPQEGPGEFASTKQAFEMLKDLPPKPKILDVGCGPGRQTIDLLRLCDGTVTAVDKYPHFLEQLKESAAKEGLSERVTIVQADMAAMEFPERSFDLIWSEGAIFCMGFEKGFVAWKPLLKEGGYIAVTELTRFEPDPPEEARAFWEGEYPPMQDAETNAAVIEKAGYRMVGRFTLPESAWRRYHDPIVAKHAAWGEKHKGNKIAETVLAREQKEVEMYRRYSRYYGYIFYVGQR